MTHHNNTHTESNDRINTGILILLIWLSIASVSIIFSCTIYILSKTKMCAKIFKKDDIEISPQFNSKGKTTTLETKNIENICSICHEKLKDNNNYEIKILKLECGHYYHKKCIKTWYLSKNYDNNDKCPLCIKPIQIEEYYI